MKKIKVLNQDGTKKNENNYKLCVTSIKMFKVVTIPSYEYIGSVFRDGTVHYINEQTLDIISYDLFTNEELIPCPYPNDVVDYFYGTVNVLKDNVNSRYKDSFIVAFPDVSLDNVVKCDGCAHHYAHKLDDRVFKLAPRTNTWTLQ